MNTDLALALTFLKGGGSPLALTASALQRALKGEILHIDAALGHVTLAFTPDAQFTQGESVLQGGIVSAMLDYALAFAALVRIPTEFAMVSATLTVNFLKPVMPDRLIVRGKVLRMGSRLAFAEAAIGKDESNILATASSVMALIPAKNFSS